MHEQHRQAEEALKAREERLKLALEAAHMGTWDSNFETDELVWSGPVEALFGLEPGSFEGTREAMYRLVHPGDRDMVREAISKGDVSGVHRTARSLKDSVDVFCAGPARQAVLALEQMGKAGALGGADEAYGALEQALDRLLPALKKRAG